jgi:DHA2 family multidrug resistance protein
MLRLLHVMAGRYVRAWGDATVAQTAALQKLWLIAYREAQVQAFADAYLVIALCFTLSLAMVPLLRKVTVADRQPRAVTAHHGVPSCDDCV